MPTITDDVYVERVQRLASQLGKLITPADIWSARDSALQRLAAEVAADPMRRAYAQVALSGVTFAAGAASLASYTDMLHEHVRNVQHSDGGNTTSVSLLPYGCSRKDLTYERNQMVFWGVVESGALYVMTGSGVDAAPDGTVDLVYSSVPTLANIHRQLVDDLIRLSVVLSEAGAQEEAV